MSYEFIQPLEKKPKVERKAAKKASIGERIIVEFREANVKYARVPFEKLKDNYKSPMSAARGMGRILTGLELADQIDIYSDDENVYLEKTK